MRNWFSVSSSVVSSIKTKLYSFFTGWQVYLGMVRLALQEHFPLLQGHTWVASVGALLVVIFIQSIMVGLYLFSRAARALGKGYAGTMGGVRSFLQSHFLHETD